MVSSRGEVGLKTLNAAEMNMERAGLRSSINRGEVSPSRSVVIKGTPEATLTGGTVPIRRRRADIFC